VADAERWLPQRAWRDLWAILVERSGDPAIALVAAQRVERGYFGVIDYAVRSSPNVSAAVAAAARLFRLANTQGAIAVSQEGELAVVERVLSGDEGQELPRQAAEYALASMVQTFRLAVAEPWRLTRVSFRYERPEHAGALEQFFATDIQFGAQRDALFIHQSVLELPMREPDSTLAALIESHARSLIAALPSDPSLAEDVRSIVLKELAGGQVSADHVARRLGLSTRSLHRQLSAAGTSFRKLLDDARRELADSYLRRGRLALGEIAYLLGYSDVTAFHRAFKGWTGKTPAAYRAQAG
jgi:AraC-like DNA-binding protein